MIDSTKLKNLPGFYLFFWFPYWLWGLQTFIISGLYI